MIGDKCSNGANLPPEELSNAGSNIKIKHSILLGLIRVGAKKTKVLKPGQILGLILGQEILA